MGDVVVNQTNFYFILHSSFSSASSSSPSSFFSSSLASASPTVTATVTISFCSSQVSSSSQSNLLESARAILISHSPSATPVTVQYLAPPAGFSASSSFWRDLAESFLSSFSSPSFSAFSSFSSALEG